jgi:hypothetical protein
VLFDIMVACSDEVREIIAESLNNSNKAIPLLLPYKSKPQLAVWQLFSIKKEWRLGEKPSDIRNERVYKYRAPVVSFIKLGSKFAVSKSETINRTLFSGLRVFSEIAFTSQMRPKEKSLGMVDLAFAQPELTDTKPKMKDLPDLLTVLNLHGNPHDHQC